MNALLKLSLMSLAVACLVSCGGGESGGKPFDEDAALRVVADAAQAASASSTPPVESATDPSLALIDQAARAGQTVDGSAATGSMPSTGGGAQPAAPGANSSAATTPGAADATTPATSPATSDAINPATRPATNAATNTAAATSTNVATNAAANTSTVPVITVQQPTTAQAQTTASATPVAPVQVATTRTTPTTTPEMVFGTTARPPVSTTTAAAQIDTLRSRPEPPLADCGLADSAEQVLRRINEIRARGASCGAKGEFAPAGALAWNTKLYAAAAGHSTDMAVNNYFAHLSPAGEAVRDRVVDLGYAYKIVAENIAAGQPSLDKVLAAWLASEGHCANLMQPAVRDVALACASEQGARYPTYWTLNIAASR